VSSDVIVSTEPDLGGGIVVATGAICAILTGGATRIQRIERCSRDGSSRRHESARRKENHFVIFVDFRGFVKDRDSC
jgi:hypothetical protein